MDRSELLGVAFFGLVFSKVNTSVENVSFLLLQVLCENDKQALFLIAVFPVIDTDCSLVHFAFGVGYTALLVWIPAGRLHPIVGVETLNFLRAPARGKCYKADLALHGGTYCQSCTQR